MTGVVLSVLLRSVILAGLGMLALIVLRKRSASVRHFVATATLGGLLILPLLKFSLPVQPVQVETVPPIVERLQVTMGAPGAITGESLVNTLPAAPAVEAAGMRQ